MTKGCKGMLNKIDEAILVKERLKGETGQIEKAVRLIIDSIEKGNRLLLCGNGGSAADAQHIAAEIVHKLVKRRRALPAIALTTNTSLLTAISSDDSYDEIFSRQIEGIGEDGDILLAISTSGNSPNVILAVKKAKSLGMKTIGLCGADGRLRSLVDIAISVPSKNTQRIQECHIFIGHIISEAVEDAFS